MPVPSKPELPAWVFLLLRLGSLLLAGLLAWLVLR